MSGIDLSGIEKDCNTSALAKKAEVALTSVATNPVPIPNKTLSSVAFGGVRATGRTAVAAIPIAAVVEVVTTALNIFDHAIQAYDHIMVEKEHTKQVQAMALAQENIARETTKQVEIQAKERTASLAIQAKSEYESKRMELQRFSMEIENEQHVREMSQERWREVYRIINEEVNSLLSMRNEVWQGLKEQDFKNDKLREDVREFTLNIDKYVNQIIELGNKL